MNPLLNDLAPTYLHCTTICESCNYPTLKINLVILLSSNGNDHPEHLPPQAEKFLFGPPDHPFLLPKIAP